MSKRAICRFPNPILSKPAEKVIRFDAEFHREVNDLIATMYASPATIGLAAPQIGISKRMFVSDLSSKDSKRKLSIFINPEIIISSGSKTLREGCLSLPDYTGNVRRAEEITVRGLDVNGKTFEASTSGLEAICWQHEIDHLDGILFIHRVSNIKTDIFRRKRYQ